MESIYYMDQVIGMAVVHSFWQGLLVFLLLKIILLSFPRMPSTIKCTMAYLAVFSLTAAFLFTLANTMKASQSPVHITGAAVPVTEIASVPGSAISISDQPYFQVLAGYLPWIAGIYLTGLCFNIIKLGFAWNTLSRIKRSLAPAVELEGSVIRFAARLGISKQVGVFFSEQIAVPGVIGHIRPLLLLPFSIVNNLTADEVEAILLHELAHIRRNDYLFNLLQQLMSVLLFFNPFFALISKIINEERENSCDDMVLTSTEKPLVYAYALLKLEQPNTTHQALVLAATGKNYHLHNRIERIMKTQKLTVNARQIMAVVVVLTAGISCLAWLAAPKEVSEQTVRKTIPQTTVKAYSMKDNVNAWLAASKQISEQTAAPTEKNSASISHSITSRSVFDDPELKKLAAEFKKHSERVNSIFDNKAVGTPAMAVVMAAADKELQKKGSLYDTSPDVKAQIDSLSSQEFDAYPHIKAEIMLMKIVASKMWAYLNRPEQLEKLKQMSESERDKYNADVTKLFGEPN